MTVPLRKRIKRRLRSALVRAAIRLFSFVPLGPALLLGALVGRLAWALAATTRRLVLANLAVAFPEKTQEEREAIGRASLVHLAQLTEFIGRMRAEGGVETLWREDPGTARAMIRSFRQGKLLGILIDQDTSMQTVFAPFFGRLAATPRGAADLALRFRVPLLAGHCRRRGPRRGDGHEIDFVEVPYDADAPDRDAEVLRLTAVCTAFHEAAIRARPEEWVWMHARWKTRPEGGVAVPQAKPMPNSAELSGG